MVDQRKLYQRLPGTGSQAFQTVRLYLASDHLLQVTSSGFTESYKRFFFQDIQSVSWQHTDAWHVWTGVWAVFAVASLIVALAASGEVALWYVASALFWIMMLVVNLLIGPSCTCRVQTAVQTQRLPSVRRVRHARKLLQKLKPLILQAQREMVAAPAPTALPSSTPDVPTAEPNPGPPTSTI